MQQRPLGRTGRDVSAIGLGTWQLGADWGAVSEEDATAVLAASVDHGVTLFDTADVYGDGRSESLIGRFLAGRPGPWHHGRHQDGPADAAGARELRARELPRVDGSVAAQSRCRDAGSRAAALSADGGDRGCRHLRRSRRARRGWDDRRVRRVGRDVCAGARRDRAAERDEHPDHLQPVPAEAPRRGAAGGGCGGGRDLRARSARVGTAVGQVLGLDDVRRRRSPHLQPSRRGVRPRRDVLGRGLRGGAGGGRRAVGGAFPRACHCRRRRSRGSHRSPA